jgi:hypothetical protein
LKIFPETKYFALESDLDNQRRLADFGLSLLETPRALNRSADLVIMSHVLEHVASPTEFLSEMTADLREGGCVFVEVPCRDWEYKSLDEPHLLFFDKKPIQLLLEKCGFSDIQVSYFGPPLQGSSNFQRMQAWRERLLARGLVWPFSRVQEGTEMLADPLERAVVTPFRAHRESTQPAWWLRAVAIKA